MQIGAYNSPDGRVFNVKSVEGRSCVAAITVGNKTGPDLRFTEQEFLDGGLVFVPPVVPPVVPPANPNL